MIRLLKRLNKKEIGLLLFSVVFICLQVFLDLALPDYMSTITELVQTPGSQMNDILLNGGKMLACAIGSLLASMIVAICASKISTDFTYRIREMLFDKVQSFSNKEMNSYSTSSLITRSTNDVTQIQQFMVMGLQMLIKSPIMAVWAVLKIAGKNFEFTLTTAVAVIVLIIVVGICVCLAVPKFKKVQKLTDNINRITRESLTGLPVVRAYNAEDYQKAKFNKANTELTNNNLFANSVMALMMPFIQSILSGLSLAIYWVGATLINSASLADKMTLFSDVIVFSSYATQVIMAFMMLVMVFIMLPRASVSAHRINEVIDTEVSIKDGKEHVQDTQTVGEIEFRNVSFKYPDAKEYVLKDISFKVSKGETIAFIGATGSGKSTLMNLILRFYDTTEGTILIDKIDIKEYTLDSLYNKFGYVPQKAVLFSGTIKSNIDYGDNGTHILDDDIVEAIEIAQASEFVNENDEGYNAFVAQGGSNYSGGQKQRLAIARAIARNGEILLFDDSFSALDYKTDSQLRCNLNQKLKDKTKVIIGQRIGTIKNADSIVVLENGKIAGVGKHKDLLHNCQVYKEIAYSQLSKEELAHG